MDADNAQLTGDLMIPENPKGLVILLQGTGRNRNNPRNMFVAEHLQRSRFATLLIDLLTTEESADQNAPAITLLTQRLISAVNWLQQHDETKDFNIGFFGASTGAAVALSAAAALGSDIVGAVVSRGGRPDLADAVLPDVASPTLLIMGGRDEEVLDFNKTAQDRLQCIKDLQLVPDATHLFEEPGALEMAAQLATDWYRKYLEPKKQHALRQE